MLIKFATRFAVVLIGILLLIAMTIHFFFTGRPAIESWIVLFPIILAVPTLISVCLADDRELGVQSS